MIVGHYDDADYDDECMLILIMFILMIMLYVNGVGGVDDRGPTSQNR